MEIKSFLKTFGLDEKEIAVYLAILKLGRGSVMDIAKKADIKRPTTYIVLEELFRKGMVDLLPKKGKTHYIAKSPKIILDLLLKKEKMAKSFVPQLMAIFNEQKKRPKILYYEGEQEVKKIYDDSIAEGKEILAFFGVKTFFKILGNNFTRNYVNSRIRNNIKAKVIVPKEQEAIDYKKKDKRELRETKFIDSSKFTFKAEVLIYGNKVAILSFDEADSFGLIIQNDQFSETIRSVFNFMWGTL